MRLASAARSLTNVMRYRTSSRNSRCGRDGIKLAFNSPWRIRSQIHSASCTSVFAPGRLSYAPHSRRTPSCLSFPAGYRAASSTPRAFHRDVRHLQSLHPPSHSSVSKSRGRRTKGPCLAVSWDHYVYHHGLLVHITSCAPLVHDLQAGHPDPPCSGSRRSVEEGLSSACSPEGGNNLWCSGSPGSDSHYGLSAPSRTRPLFPRRSHVLRWGEPISFCVVLAMASMADSYETSPPRVLVRTLRHDSGSVHARHHRPSHCTVESSTKSHPHNPLTLSL